MASSTKSTANETDVTDESGESQERRPLRERKKTIYNEQKLAKRASASDSENSESSRDDDSSSSDREVDEEVRCQPLELWADVETTASQDGADTKGAISGQNVYGFITKKRKGAMRKSVAYSTSAAVREKEDAATHTGPSGTSTKKPKRDNSTEKDDMTEDVMKTPSRKKGEKGNQAKKSHLLKTPHRLRRRMDHGIDLDEESDASFSEGSDDDSEDSDDDFSQTENNNEKPHQTPTPTLELKAPSISQAKNQITSRRRLDEQLMRTETQQVQEAESYFDAHKSNQVLTSDHTLNKLETPKLSPEQVATLLVSAPSHHAAHIQDLLQSHAALFRKWILQLSSNYSVLLYGLGSKRQLLEMFRQNFLQGEYDHVTVNGYFPGLTAKQIFSCILEELFDQGYRSFKTPSDQLAFLQETLKSDPRDFFVVFHNIDGGNLRKEKIQQVLAQLAALPGCHLIASVDHINAPLLWDQAKLAKFRWVWYDATTFCPYVDETSYETSLMIQQSGQLALSSLLHVIKSLTPNAKKIFVLLATEQLALGDSPNFQGMSFNDLYQRCRAEFLVNSDLTLKAQLTEFKDHKLIRVKKGGDGVEYLTIPLDSATIIEFMEDYES